LHDRFYVERVVRRTAALSVSRAQDALRLGPVTLVVLHPDADGSAALRDATRAAEVRHPGLLPALHTGRHGSLAYFIEPWCAGTPLAELLEDGPLSTGRAIHLAQDLLAATAALHAAGVVHGAIEPENVLVERDWSGRERARLAVVGARHALALDRLPAHVPGIARADLHHVAPELFRGAEPTPATDVYEIGLLLGWMLAGHPPFDGVGYGELARAHRETPPPELTELDAPALAATVERCLAKAPSDRFSSAAQASRALRRKPLPLPSEGASVDALDATVARCSEEGDWRGAARALERKVAAVGDPMWQVATLFQLAELAESELRDPGWAARAYEAVLDRQPDDFDAFDGLSRLYADAGRHDDLVGLLLDRARWSHDPEEHVELHARAAALREDAGDVGGALVLLGRGFERTGDDARLGDELRRLAAAVQAPEALIALYTEVAARSRGDTAPLWRRLAEWCEGDAVGLAVMHLRRVLIEAPDDAGALDRLEALLERTGRWVELADVLRTHAARAFDPDEHAALLLRLARALEAQPDAETEAAAVRMEVVDLGVEAPANLDALGRLFRHLERWADLAALLDRRVGLAQTSEERIALRLRVGSLCRSQLDDPERALAAYLAVLDDDPGSRDALGPAEVLLTQLERPADLAELYRRALPTRDERDQIALLTRLADTQPPGPDLVETCWRLLRLAPRRTDTVERLRVLLTAESRWTELAAVYAQHIEALGEAPPAVEPLLALAAVQRDEVDDLRGAIESLERVVAIAPEHTEAVSSLVDLCARAERFERCVELLGREVHWPDDAGARVERWCRIGRLLLTELDDPAGAMRRLHETLLYAPGHPAALDALAELHEQHGDWDRLAHVLRARAEHATEPGDYGDALVRLGDLHAERLSDSSGALAYYEHAVEIDPSQDVAAERLADAWWAQRRWPQARQMYALVLGARDDAPPSERLALHLRAAACDEATGAHDEAFDQLRAAFEIDGTNRDALLGMSRQLFRRQSWDRALSVYQTLLFHHRDTLDPQTLAEIAFRQGMIKQLQGVPGRAEAFFEQTLAHDPRHREALAGLAALHEETGDWVSAAAVCRRQIEAAADEAERTERLVRLGDILREHAADPRGAAEAYAAAQATGGAHVSEKLLGLARQRRDWPEVARLSLELADVEPHPRGQARRAFAAAEILRDRLEDTDAAAEAFERALEADPGMWEAFGALDDMLAHDAERHTAALRRMLHRATEADLDADLVAGLARRLGRLNATADPADAIRLFRAALARAPDDAATHTDLAELFEHEGDLERALQHTWRALAVSPHGTAPAHRLFRLLRAAGEEDGAWCVAHALGFRGRADADEAALCEAREGGVPGGMGPLPDDAWASIDPPSKSAILDRFFLVATPYALPSLESEAALERLEPTPGSAFFHALAEAAGVFGVEPPACVRAPAGHGVRAVIHGGPALAVAPDVADELSPAQLAFLCGRSVYLLAQQHMLAALDGTREQARGRLGALIRAVALGVAPFDAVTEADGATLRGLLETLDRDAAGVHDLDRWLNATDLAADRVGLLLAADLGAAASLVDDRDRIDALVSFAMSDAYFELRRAVGFTA